MLRLKFSWLKLFFRANNLTFTYYLTLRFVGYITQNNLLRMRSLGPRLYHELLPKTSP
jgi:hypothetical protein